MSDLDKTTRSRSESSRFDGSSQFDDSRESLVLETMSLIDQYVNRNRTRKSPPEHICLSELGSASASASTNANECSSDNIAKCIQATCSQCDAPTISALLNTVYTALPRFKFTESSGTITFVSLDVFTSQSAPYLLPTFDYYIRLADKSDHEIRMLWPIVWTIPELINQLGTSRFIFSSVSGDVTGYVSFRLNLNILSNKIITDPTQALPVLSTDLNDFTAGQTCGDVVATWAYNFVLAFIPTTPGNAAILNNIMITMYAPNNTLSATILVAPPAVSPAGTQLTSDNFTLSEPIPSSAVTFNMTLINLLSTTNIGTISPIVVSSAQSANALQAILLSYGADTTNLSLIASGNLILTPTPLPTDTTISLQVTPNLSVPPETIIVPVPTTGYLNISSFAHYISFILAESNKEWLATTLEKVSI